MNDPADRDDPSARISSRDHLDLLNLLAATWSRQPAGATPPTDQVAAPRRRRVGRRLCVGELGALLAVAFGVALVVVSVLARCAAVL